MPITLIWRYRALLSSTAVAAIACGCASSGSGGRVAEPIYVFAPPSEAALAAVRYPNLREELLDMVERDQRARMGMRAAGDDDRSHALATMTRIDDDNTKRMHEIVDEVGWPTKSAVGSDGTQAAWLLVQHADRDVAFQHRCLELMKAELGREEVYAANVAYLTDRVLVNEGEKQEYGTQFHDVDGKPQPRPIRDAENVDARREKMGLSTLEEYKKLMKT